MTRRFDLILFDLDGTLIETAPEIADAVNDTLAQFGLHAVTQAKVEDWIGHGTRSSTRMCVKRFGVKAERALFVDDSSIDVATARNAGVSVWALTYGYNMREPIDACKPDRVIADVSALLLSTVLL